MLSVRRSLVLLLVGALVASNFLQPVPAAAAAEPQQQPQQQPQQRHVVDHSEMGAALARSAAVEAEDREAIRGLLRDPHVRQIAATLGLEIRMAEAAVAVLGGDELVQLADGARAAEAALAGGQSLTVSYTLIIIVLLLVILLVLLV